MVNYFISVVFENDQYFGKVYTASSNQLIYTSKGYYSQEQASKDARTYIITSAPPPPIEEATPETNKTVTTTASYTAPKFGSRTPSGRCCGR